MSGEVAGNETRSGSRSSGAAEHQPYGGHWQDDALVQHYLTGVRGALPGAAEHLAILMRLVASLGRPVLRVLDLGAGDGVLTATLLGAYPGVDATLVDFSPPMLAAARARFAHTQPPVRLLERDLGQADWANGLRDSAPFDVIVSGYAIHHLPDARKSALYTEVFALLAPGGIFLNLDHVSSASDRLAEIFDQAMVEALTQFRRRDTPDLAWEEVDAEYCTRPDRLDNILAPVDRQCAWLRAIGFTEVDCFAKWFELALFGGFKPVAVGEGSPWSIETPVQERW